MSRVVEYAKGPFTYKGEHCVHISEDLYKDFNTANDPIKRIGVTLKPDGVGYLYYKEQFDGDKKPEPAKEFIELLEKLEFKNPKEMTYFHILELDENGSVLQELDPKDF